MNDAASSDGNGGGGSSTDEAVKALGKELQREATEKKITEIVEAEDPLENQVKFTDTLAEAKADVTMGKVEEYGDGRLKCHFERLSGPGHSTTTWYYPRDSQAWKEVFDSYESIVDNVVRCGQYDSSGLLMSMVYLDDVISGLDQGTDLADKAEEIAETSTEDLAKNLSTYFGGSSDWDLSNTAYDALEGWEGYAAEMFRLAYLGRLPAILIGQMVVTKVLRGTLEMVDEVYKSAGRDGEILAQSAIYAFDGQGTDIDAVSSEELQAAAYVMQVAAGVTAFFPGEQPVSAVLGGIASILSIGAYLQAKQEKAEKKGNEPEKPKYTLDADTADGLMDQVDKQADKIHDAVRDLQEKSKKWLDGVYELATSSEPAKVKVTPLSSDGGGSVSLTQRQAFFEPKEPALAALEKKSGDPGIGTLSDDGVFGVAPDTGKQFAGDLKALWNVGNKWLPSLAESYESLAGDAESAGYGVAGALEPPGVMTESWTNLHGELVNIFKGASANLKSVGDLMKIATEAYADDDTATEKQLIKDYEGELPWK